MLWDPKHDKPVADPLDRANLISFLRTRKKTERYDYGDIRGECALSQYMIAFGYPDDHWVTISPHNGTWVRLNHKFCNIVSEKPWTFGAAAKRAEQEVKLLKRVRRMA
jgi:hypothetical protein